MKFTFIEKKLQVDDAVKAYAEKKIGKIDRLFRHESEAFITFGAERGRYRAEVTLNNNGMYYRVSEVTGDIYASIDSAAASIERQIRKNKTRLSKKLREGNIEWAPVMAAEPEEEEDEFRIVRTKRFSLKPMTTEEAILQMNLLGHDFFVYRNEGDVVSVVYRRKNGGYGVLETDGTED